MISFKLIEKWAREAGLPKPFLRDFNALGGDQRLSLSSWQDAGYAADMSYMLRPSEIFIDPQKFLTDGQSILSFIIPYSSARLPQLKRGWGRIARYAWGRDYHRVIKKRLQSFINLAAQELNKEINYRTFVDAVPLLERAFAAEAGAGFVGKNSMLIQHGLGSYFFIAELLWDQSCEAIDKHPKVKGSCGSCTLCRASCPTEALVADRVLDARRCIAYLTIEKRGSLRISERDAIGEWLFGCDLCQECCPHNRRSLKEERKSYLKDLGADAGSGGVLELGALFTLRNDSDFADRFAGTALMRAKREGLLRNAAVVAVNSDSEALTENLVSLFKDDISPIVRQHALWAACELGRKYNNLSVAKIDCLLNRALKDESEFVKSEAINLSEKRENSE